MKIHVNDVNFNADAELVSFVEKKVSKLDTFFDSIIGVEVILKVVKPETSENKEVEVKVSIPNSDYLFSKKHADTFEEAADMAVDAVKKQLIKYKDKLHSK